MYRAATSRSAAAGSRPAANRSIGRLFLGDASARPGRPACPTIPKIELIVRQRLKECGADLEARSAGERTNRARLDARDVGRLQLDDRRVVTADHDALTRQRAI